MKKAIVYIFLFAGVILLQRYLSPPEVSFSIEFLGKSFNGEIVDKFVDVKNHSVPTLILQNDDSRMTVQCDHYLLTDSLYSVVKVGDWIEKKIGLPYYSLIKSTGTEVKYLE